MMNLMHLLDWSNAWIATLARASWQGGLTALAVWSICRLVPSIPARFQCWLWRLAVLKFAIALVWQAPVELAVLPPEPAPAVTTIEAESSPMVAERSPLGAMPAVVSPRPSITATGPFLLLVVWGGLFAWQAALIFAARRAAERLRNGCRESRDPSLPAQLAGLGRANDRGIAPALLEIDGGGSPFVIGVGRPAVVFPTATLARLNLEERELVLAHETAHIVRRDLFWSGCAALVRAAFWFHPLVWLVEKRLNLSQEIAADEWAIARRSGDPVDYAGRLVSIVGKLGCGAPRPGFLIGVSGSQHSLQRRLTAMRFIRPVSSRVAWSYAMLLSTAAIVGLVPWALTAADAPAKPKGAEAKGAESRSAESRSAESKSTEAKTPESKPGGAATAKTAPKERIERGRFVSYADGTLTIEANSGAKLEHRVPAGAKGFVWSNQVDKYVPADAAEALGQAKPGDWFYVNSSEDNFTFRVGSRKGQTIGTFVSFQDDRLLMLGKNLGGSYAKKYGNNVHFHKFRDDTPIYESVDGGEYKLMGKANKILSTVREGTVVTVYGEGDDNITRVEIGVVEKK